MKSPDSKERGSSFVGVFVSSDRELETQQKLLVASV